MEWLSSQKTVILLNRQMSSLKDLQKPIKEELKEFEKHFEGSMKSSVPLLDRITHYIVKRKGKQVRPTIVFLSAKTFAPVRKDTHIAASLIELLHTASLVHDDVVDDAHMRRGFFSVNAIWKNKIAVLVGDFMYAKGFLLALENKHYNLLEIISQAVKEMSEGELLQMEKAKKLDITEEVYYDIIKRKTASMLAASCAAGAASVMQEEDIVTRMRSFGYAAGMAYQIKDDLFDYGYGNIGKPTGIDIKEKKLTLPLIYALRQADQGSSKRILKLIKKHNKKSSTKKEVIQFVKEYKGMEYAEEKMFSFKNEALEILKDFPVNESSLALSNLLDFMIMRNK